MADYLVKPWDAWGLVAGYQPPLFSDDLLEAYLLDLCNTRLRGCMNPVSAFGQKPAASRM